MTEIFEQAKMEDTSEHKTTRRSRSTDNREFESRAANQRTPIVYGTRSRFNFPEETIKRFKDMGYELNYVVISSGNQEQKENYYDALERGHEPLLASEDPSLARNYGMDPFGSRDDADQFIRKGGQVATKIKIETAQAERDHYNDENKRTHYMTEMHKLAANNPGAPKPFLDERRRERIH